jgi:two-component system cell cycle sensor histidine kinase/response regulator CckA
VLEADSGPEALLLSQRHAGPIQLMLTDIIMPGMNGHILAERLVSSRSDTVVLYMSGYAGASAGRQGSIGPDTSLVMKPFTPEQLLDKVRELLDLAKGGANGDTCSASSGY